MKPRVKTRGNDGETSIPELSSMLIQSFINHLLFHTFGLIGHQHAPIRFSPSTAKWLEVAGREAREGDWKGLASNSTSATPLASKCCKAEQSGNNVLFKLSMCACSCLNHATACQPLFKSLSPQSRGSRGVRIARESTWNSCCVGWRHTLTPNKCRSLTSATPVTGTPLFHRHRHPNHIQESTRS